MKQLNFQMKKLTSETLQTLINELKRPASALVRNFSEKKILHDKVVLLTRRCSEWGTRNHHQIIFWKGFNHHIHTENIGQKINFL